MNDPLRLRSRYSSVTFKEFGDVMAELGFQESRTAEGFRRYYHSESDTNVVIPVGDDGDLVPSMYIRGHGKVLDWRGIVSEERLHEMLASQKVA